MWFATFDAEAGTIKIGHMPDVFKGGELCTGKLYFAFNGKLYELILNMKIEEAKQFETLTEVGSEELYVSQLSKIRQLAEWRKEMGLNYDIEVDGGITIDNVREVLDAGANVIVAGSAVFGKEDIAAAAKGFMDIFKEYE